MRAGAPCAPRSHCQGHTAAWKILTVVVRTRAPRATLTKPPTALRLQPQNYPRRRRPVCERTQAAAGGPAAAADDDEPLSPAVRAVFLAVCVATFFSAVSRVAFSVLAPTIQLELGLSLPEVGLLQSALLVGYAAGQVRLYPSAVLLQCMPACLPPPQQGIYNKGRRGVLARRLLCMMRQPPSAKGLARALTRADQYHLTYTSTLHIYNPPQLWQARRHPP